ncbi:hypothetical protein V3C99_005167, partial [Haemonchus contortus]|uniref:Ovule protein n=1 Tax=Haemonchus contortus TaxID=6289 RepID=A0A7I4XVN2_HAECO
PKSVVPTSPSNNVKGKTLFVGRSRKFNKKRTRNRSTVLLRQWWNHISVDRQRLGNVKWCKLQM